MDHRHHNNPGRSVFIAYPAGMQVARHHPNRLAAIAAGQPRWRGPLCADHGLVDRYVTGNRCIVCSRLSARESARRKAARPEVQAARAGRLAGIAARKVAADERRARPNIPNHPARLAALAAGKHTWRGPDCRHKHGGLRYTSATAACVECRRISNWKDKHRE